MGNDLNVEFSDVNNNMLVDNNDNKDFYEKIIGRIRDEDKMDVCTDCNIGNNENNYDKDNNGNKITTSKKIVNKKSKPKDKIKKSLGGSKEKQKDESGNINSKDKPVKKIKKSITSKSPKNSSKSTINNNNNTTPTKLKSDINSTPTKASNNQDIRKLLISSGNKNNIKHN